MKLSTCSARAATREGTVKNAAIKIIKRKAQANYSPAPGARAAAGEQVIVIIKLEDRGGRRRIWMQRRAGQGDASICLIISGDRRRPVGTRLMET